MKKNTYLLWLAQLFLVPCFSQNFTYYSDSPFGIKPIRNDMTRPAQRIFFYDFDHDGDLDLFMSGLDHIDNVSDPGWNNIHYFMEMQVNTGTKWNPQFGPRMTPFENFPFPKGYFFPSLGDVNGDGHPDFMVTAEVDYIGNRTLTYCKNLGQNLSGPFSVTRADSMGLRNFLPESLYIPELVDLDHDGDLDLLMSGFDPAFAEEDGDDIPTFYYAKNVGTPTVPQFSGWYDNPYGLNANPFGLAPNTFFEATASGDIDNDGDVDILGAPSVIPTDSLNYIYFHKNTPGPNGKPAFSVVTKSPFGLPNSFGNQQFLFPTLVDLDGDGDLDFFVFKGTSQNSVLKYYKNNLCTLVTTSVTDTICEGDSLVIGGIVYDTPGNYTIHLARANGCDSIIMLTLSLIQPSIVSLDETICQGESYPVGNESFNATGNYMILLSAANGCDSVVLLSLTVNETFITPLTESICEGGSYQVGNQSFDSPGHYNVVLSSQTGCDSTISLDLSVTHVDNTVSAIDNTVTANLSGASYQWIDCDSGENIPGETSQSFTPTVTGNYAVSITDGSGCSAVSGCTLVMVTGTKEAILSKGISIYPNPAKGWINILNSNSVPISKISLISLSGHVIKEINPDGAAKVDVSFLDQGVYMLKMKMNGLDVVKKLIILK
jgi:hypothetical protein